MHFVKVAELEAAAWIQTQTTATKILSAFTLVPNPTVTVQQQHEGSTEQKEKTQQVTKCHFLCSLSSSASTSLSPPPQSSGSYRDTDTVSYLRAGQPMF